MSVDVHAELVGHDLRERGHVALAVGGHPDQHPHRPGGEHLDRRRVPAAGDVLEGGEDPRGGEAAHLGPAGEADPDLLGGRRSGAVPPAGGGRGVVDRLDHRVVGEGVVARVDRQAARDREVGEAVGRDVVLAPQLGRIHPELARQHVHRPLDGVGGLGPAGAAVGVGGRGVRVDVRVLEVVALDVVEAPVEPGRQHLDAGGHDLVVGADRAADVDADGLQRRRRASRPSPCRCRGRARGSWRGSPRSAPRST